MGEAFMSEIAELFTVGTTGREPGSDVSGTVPPPRRPNLRGDLDEVLEFLPSFRPSVRGYDRSQVDSYVSWAERELRAARRSADEMAARFGASAVELDRVRRELACATAGSDARQVSERMAQVLELAAEEAAEITAAGVAEAEGLVEAARTYSAAMLRHAREAQDAATADLRRVATTRAEAEELLAAAREEAEQIRAAAQRERDRLAREAAGERDRLDEEAAGRRAVAEEQARWQREQESAAAAEVVAAARREIEQLHAQRDRAGESLRQLTASIGAAIQTLRAGGPGTSPNVVAAQPRDRTPTG
jgi:colicin import membrane protein